MLVFHVSAECYPLAKVGGLADVVGALPKYLNQIGVNTKVIMPAYQNQFFLEHSIKPIYESQINLGSKQYTYTINQFTNLKSGFDLYLISIPGLFDRPNVYEYEDDTERFMAFQIAFLHWITHHNQHPDVIHCHDHHTGLVPFMVQFCDDFISLKTTPTVLTIHNAQYQGWFGFDKMHYLPKFNSNFAGYLEWDNVINPLASAIKCADKVTTVSHSYMQEMTEHANGLENLLKYEQGKSIGILNGIDFDVWNPKNDPKINNHYGITNFSEGKILNKKYLCEKFSLDPEKPLFTFIGRLVWEKGADVLSPAIKKTLQDSKNNFSVLLLGSGDHNLEYQFKQLQSEFPKNIACYIGYNETLAHQIYAGADFLLMPSRVEPCGLNQMYAMRYGTLPIVRRVGGLKDTVVDMGDGGLGICHNQTAEFDIIHSIGRAIELYNNPKKTNQLRRKAMKIDHSWERVATEYQLLYQSIIKINYHE